MTRRCLYEIVQEEYEPITGVRAGVPMELEFIAGKCLAKPPGQRYQTTAELVVDLETLWEKLKSGKSAVRRADVAVGDEGARHVAPVQRSHGVGVQTGRASQQTKSPAVASNEVVPKQNHRMLQALLGGAIIAFLALAFIHFGETPPEAPEAPRTALFLCTRITLDGRESGQNLPERQAYCLHRQTR